MVLCVSKNWILLFFYIITANLSSGGDGLLQELYTEQNEQLNKAQSRLKETEKERDKFQQKFMGLEAELKAQIQVHTTIMDHSHPSVIILIGMIQNCLIYRVCQKKRKPVLSVTYLHCHPSFNQTIYASLSRAFSLLSFDTKHIHDISMHDWKGTI